MSKRPPITLAEAMAINRIADRIRSANQSVPAQKPSVDTSPERLRRLARYLDELPPGPTTHIHDLHEETAAVLRALLEERGAARAVRGDETMAWAVVMEVGGPIPREVYPTLSEAKEAASLYGGRPVRAAIRVVEGGDDE